MFDLDATRIALIGSHLVARMPDDEGRMKNTEIDLNDHIGNNDGASPLPPSRPHLRLPTRLHSQTNAWTALIAIRAGKLEWGGDRFFNGPGVSFLLEEGQDGPVLHATVRRENGEAVESAVPLAERIRNEDGNLVFSMWPEISRVGRGWMGLLLTAAGEESWSP